MTQRIELKYRGICHGGPWGGQQIDAEFPLISHNDGGYEYCSTRPNTWLWRASAALSSTDKLGEVKK